MKLLFFMIFFTLFSFASTLDLSYDEKEFLNDHPVMKVSNEKDWAPYDFQENGIAKGYAIDYLKLIAKRLDVQFVFITDTWSNLVKKIKTKQIDIIHPISFNKNREQFLNYSDTFIKSDMSIVTASNNKDIVSLKDLRFKTVAVGKGWNTTQYLKKFYPEIIFKEYDTSKRMLEAVAFGEVEATIEGALTANYIKQRYLLTNIKVGNRVKFENINLDLHIATRKDWTLLSGILNKAMKDISHEEMLALNRKWINVKPGNLQLTIEERKFLKENPIFKTRVAPDYYPFTFTEKNKPGGYIIEYTNLLAKKLGITIEYIKGQSWVDALQDLKSQKLDIIPLMKKTPERREYALFSSSILQTYVGIAALDSKIKNMNMKNLKHKKVGVLTGYWVVQNIKKNYPHIEIVNYNTNLDALFALRTGEIDAVISTEAVLNYLVKQNYLVNIKAKPILNNPYLQKTVEHYGIRKDWVLLPSILQKAMQSLNDEEVLKLQQKWFGKQTSFSSPLSLEFTRDELNYLKNKQQITMCIDPNWLPYEKFDKGKHIGMSYDYFNYFRQVLPIPIKTIQTNTWDDTLTFAKNRVCDIVSLAVETPSRKEYLDFPGTYLQLPLVVATTPDKPFIASIIDVMDKPLGVVKGYAYIELLKEKYPQINLIEVPSMKEGFAKVLSGEFYGFIDSLASVGYAIQNDFLGNIKIAGKIEENLDIGIGVRNDEKLLSSVFDKLVKSIDEGEHNRILNKWVSVKYDKAFDYTLLWQILLVVSIIVSFLVYRQYSLKKQNDLLQASNEEFEALIDSTIEALYILENGKCIDVNSEGIKLFGFESRDDVIGLHALEVVHPDFQELFSTNFKENVTEPYEAKVIKDDGKVIPVLIKGRKFNLRNKEVSVTAMIDLTELKHKEKLLSEHTKMVALGEMLSNISHQWRQPLSIISTVASGVKMQKEMNMLDEDNFGESMDSIIINTKYLSNTIDDFTNFIKEEKILKTFALKEHVNKNLTILHSMLKLNNITPIVSISEKLTLTTLENELAQVFMNIINNAKDAFNEQEIEERYIFIEAKEDEGKVIITLKDTAGGIADDVIDKIFEPYFTTKHKSQGTGLGLYMTSKIINDSLNGKIEVENILLSYGGNDYKGALFRLTL